MSADAAYRHCERVTRQRAGNFYYGIRLLPADKRLAMCAVYAFARRVDDVGDGDMAAAEKLTELDALGTRLAAVDSPNGDPELVALADAHERFDLPLEALDELIEGVRIDTGPVEFRTFSELERYCRLVAGSIGRLCVAIFGASDPIAAPALADDIGVGMQLTNIMRDVREDFERGRIYLPAEDRDRFGCVGFPYAPPEAMSALLAFEAERGRERFARGMGLLPLLDRRSASCVLVMTGIYRRLLSRIDDEPAEVMRRRLSLPAWEKTWIAARSMFEAAL